MKLHKKEFNKLINFVERTFAWDSEAFDNFGFCIVDKDNDVRIYMYKDRTFASIFIKKEHKFFDFKNFEKVREFKNAVKLIAAMQ